MYSVRKRLLQLMPLFRQAQFSPDLKQNFLMPRKIWINLLLAAAWASLVALKDEWSRNSSVIIYFTGFLHFSSLPLSVWREIKELSRLLLLCLFFILFVVVLIATFLTFQILEVLKVKWCTGSNTDPSAQIACQYL